jgi:glucosamine kinase
MTASLFLGIDGGGTRCRARLETADSRVLGRGVSGPGSMRFGIEAVSSSIMNATRQALAEARLGEDVLARTYLGAGLAGTGIPGARAALETWKHPFAGAWFEGDGYTGFLGAFGGADGGIVVAGTGSIGVTYQGRTVRVGGYGFPVSDEGSGADLGLNALRHALRALDGREAPSGLSRDVLAKFSDDSSEVSGWLEGATATDYAMLAPLVVSNAAAGDEAALRLMRQAATQIADLAEALFAKGAPQVALIGGLAAALKPHMPAATAARLVKPQGDAMAGAILLAKQKAGVM